jgi:hypothetical protein
MDAEPTVLEIACEGALRDHFLLDQQLKASRIAGRTPRLEAALNAVRMAIERYRAR